jgi:Fungal Zn(2)-Cys(6) binuclear cluster domain
MVRLLAGLISPFGAILTLSCSRGRKIRCDSTRPVCNNCVRRSNVCEYDAVPKRRGPDKRPGTRQRSCKKRPADGPISPVQKRKKTATDYLSDPRDTAPSRVKENMADKRSPTSRHSDRPQDIHSQTQGHHLSASPTELHISTEVLPPVKVSIGPRSFLLFVIYV